MNILRWWTVQGEPTAWPSCSVDVMPINFKNFKEGGSSVALLMLE
jgi:hypothetical protein